MKFHKQAPTVKILELLKDSISPLDIKAIFNYLLALKFSKKQIHNSLRRLEAQKFIVSNGRKKSKLYRISETGLKALFNYKTKNTIKISISKVEDYLIRTGDVL
jgi:DNA-binding PadR family transcriptional regulator